MLFQKSKKNEGNPKNKPILYDRTNAVQRILRLILLAFGIVLVVEFCNRGLNTLKVLSFIVNHPFYFLYNVLIVGTTLSFSELFRRRRAVLFIQVVLWLAIGIGNCLVIQSRTQPFASMDLLMLGDALSLTTIYYTWPQIIAMYGAIFLTVVLVIFIVTRLPKRKRVKRAIPMTVFAGLTILCVCLCSLGRSAGVFPKYYDNLIEAYEKYGFATCFTFTFGSMGVSKPSDYSSEAVTTILEDIEPTEEAEKIDRKVFTEEDDLKRPNIIYVQLESFFDAREICDTVYDVEPTPNFNRLCSENPSGELYMSSVGGGTANSEFEVLTGFALDFFGTGEYPFSTVLKEKTCESIAYDLMNLDYVTTGMHNNTGTFYGRNDVYGRLGFEHYVSLEYMPYVTYTEIGWSEDIVLRDEILKAMQATEERDFVMAVTVESHGKYADTYEYRQGDPVPVTFPEQINKAQFENYLHLIHETDKFIGELVKALESFEEPVICVFYGDHLPSLNLTSDILKNNNLYATRYVIWNNYGAEFTAPDMQAYRLSAELLKQLGIPGGVIMRFHQSYAPDCADEEYMEKLKTLEYDLLYGDGNGYDNGRPPKAVDMVQGSVPIVINGVNNQYGRVLVTGQNFTEYSTILLDGTAYPTAYVSSAQIVCVVPKNMAVDIVEVAQMTADGIELGRTVPFKLNQQTEYTLPKLATSE